MVGLRAKTSGLDDLMFLFTGEKFVFSYKNIGMYYLVALAGDWVVDQITWDYVTEVQLPE